LGFFFYDYAFAPNKIWLYAITTAIVLGYEPLAIAWRGQTLGHWFKKIQVVRAGNRGRVGFFRALLRYIIKYSIWPLSISWMVFSHWHHSIQDIITNTRSVPAGVAAAPIDEESTDVQKAGVRQVLVTLRWLFATLWLFNTGLDWLFPQCNRRFLHGYCKAVAWVDDLGDIMIWILVFWYGTGGKLLGARFKS